MPRTSKKGDAKKLAAVPAVRIWKTAIYARLSVEDGGNKGSDTLDTQLSLLNAYVNEKEYLSLFDTYIDNGESGRDFDRPAWNKLMDDIRAGLVDCVCVKDLSRFGRNYIETCEFLEKIFPFMGVRFISANDGYDSEVGGKHSEGLIIALKNLMHDRFLKDVSHKVGQAFQAKKQRGEYTGGFAPFGYKLSPTEKSKLVIDDEAAPIIRDIFQWRADGIGLRGICRKLNEMGIPTGGNLHKKMRENTGETEAKTLWWPTSVKKLIQSRVYLGYLETGKTIQKLGKLTRIPRSEWHVTENAHEAIVSKELWEAANAVKGESYADKNTEKLPANIFRGFLNCGICGKRLTRKHSKTKGGGGKFNEYYFYFCPVDYQHRDERFKYTSFDKINDVLFPLVTAELKRAANLGAIIEKRTKSQTDPRSVIQGEISKTAHEIENISGRLSRLYENYVEGLLIETEYIIVKSEYERRTAALREKAERLSARASVLSDVSDNPWLKAARDFQNPKALTREMLEALVEQVTVFGPGNIKVAWKYRDEFALLEACATEEVC